MASTFFARIDELAKIVGDGEMELKVQVDQVYAFNQEVGYWINFLGSRGFHTLFPRHGGTLHALALALASAENPLWEACAVALMVPDGLYGAMVGGAEEISSLYSTTAPVETGALRHSGHPTVTDNGAVVYDRPPLVGRIVVPEEAETGGSM